MTPSLWNLVGGSSNATLHRRAFISTVLVGASSRFWDRKDSSERLLSQQLTFTKQLSGSRIPHDQFQQFSLTRVTGRSGFWCQGWSWSWSNGNRNPQFAVRASSSSGGGNFGKKSGSSSNSSAKTKVHYVCENCGETFSQWWGACQNCRAMNSLMKFSEPVQSTGPRGGAAARAVERISLTTKSAEGFEKGAGKGAWLKGDGLRPQRLADVVKGYSKQHWRLALPGETGSEVSRVLGGGIVPGSLILIGGDPGVGKSTLLLQIAGLLSLGSNDDPAPVLYISGEEVSQQVRNKDTFIRIGYRELVPFSALPFMFPFTVCLAGRGNKQSVEQISDRAGRMQIGAHELFLYSATDLELVLEAIQELKPRAVVVDSIQTVYLPEATGSAGSVIQVRECAAALLRLAKQTSIPIFLVGHVTKTGEIAGPRVLEHIVDVVLYMEGERLQSHRLLRVVKNRYGSSDEVGVFEMVEGGLKAITNPSALFLSERAADSNFTPAAAVAVTMEGSRPLLLEVQALCSLGGNQQPGRRTANGVDNQRLYLLLAVLMKQAGLKLQNQDVFINVVGGLQLREPASDVAVAIAICSSFLEKPVPRDMAFIGEIGLGGEIRSVGQLERRITEAAKLGFKSCIVPRSVKAVVKNIAAIPCADIREVLERALGWPE